MQFQSMNAPEASASRKKTLPVDADFVPRVAVATTLLHDTEDLLGVPTLEIGDMNSPQTCGTWYPGQICTLLENRLSFTAHTDDEQTIQAIRNKPEFFFTSSDLQEQYFPFCDDFGPVNLGIVVQFHKFLRSLLDDPRLIGRHVVYYCDNDQDVVSNTVFLLSSFLLLEYGWSPAQAFAPFERLPEIPILPFRDAAYSKSTFPLSVKDCLCSLRKAAEHQWLNVRNFDLEEYLGLDDPSIGDIHKICPNVYASRSPAQDSEPEDPDSENFKDAQVQQFRRIGVTRVLHLIAKHEPAHGKDMTEEHVHHLRFEDSTPSDAEVEAFLQQCIHAKSEPVAVCCETGLGRTGTMIGVWIMKEFGFSAREAIAWMRIVRPGVVIGPQQHYLEDVEKRLAAGTFRLGEVLVQK